MFFLIFICCVASCFLPGCITQPSFISHHSINKTNTPVFLALPQNLSIALNLGPLVHKTLLRVYKRAGYQLATSKKNNYLLATKITKFENQQKFVSPDVLLFHVIIVFEIDAQLYDTNHKLIEQKAFSISTLVSKPKNQTLEYFFTVSTLDKNLLHLLTRVEQHFRKYLIPKKTLS